MSGTRTCLIAGSALGLAALSLAGLSPARAGIGGPLTLQSGDNVTVSRTGTTNSGGPTAVTSTYTGYSDSGSGMIYAVQTNGTATFTLNGGGTLTDTQGFYGLDARGSGSVTITGGQITTTSGIGLNIQGSGPVTISGGSISAGQNGSGVFAGGSGQVTITGGSLSAGSGGYDLYTNGNSGGIDLYGTFTLISGQTVTDTTNLAGGPGNFSGTLYNNATGQTFTYDNNSRITLHPTPEPSPCVTLALGTLWLCGLGWRARKTHPVSLRLAIPPY